MQDASGNPPPSGPLRPAEGRSRHGAGTPIRSGQGAGTPPSQSRTRRWTLTLLVVWLALTYAPLSRAILRGPVYTRALDGAWSVHNEDLRTWRGLRWSAGFGAPKVTLATQIEDHTVDLPFPCQRIWVLCRTPGPVAHALGEELTLALLDRPGMQEVGYFTYRQLPNSAFRPPDLWITIDRLEGSSLTLPGHARSQGRLQVRMGQSTMAGPKDLFAGPHWVGQLTYSSSRTGLVPAASRWLPIARALRDALPLQQVLDRWQGPPERALPAVAVRWLHPPIRCETIAALKQHLPRVQQVAEGPAWMMHDVTSWVVESDGDAQETAATLLRNLRSDGWELEGDGAGIARLRRGSRQIDLRPLHGKPDQTLLEDRWGAQDDRPLVLTHLHPFTTSEIAEYLQEVQREGIPETSLQSLIAHVPPDRRRAVRTWLRQAAEEPQSHADTAERARVARLIDLLYD